MYLRADISVTNLRVQTMTLPSACHRRQFLY